MACPMDRQSNPVPFAGDVQVRAFASFVSNHVQWERSFQTFSHNEAHTSLWIRSEPQNPGILLARYKSVLSSPSQEQHIIKLQQEVISTCTKFISRQQKVALDGSQHRWQAASSALRNRDPYCFKNFKHALSRVKGYVGCMEECGVNWLGLKFKFPLIWWPAEPYNMDFSMTRAEEQRCWHYWVIHRGFPEADKKPQFPYNFSSLHEQSSM